MKRLALVMLAVFGLFLSGCGGEGAPEAGPPTELPKITIGHVGHDHQIALYVAALEPGATKARCGVWLKEKKPREVYDLMEDGKAVAEVHLVKVGGGSNMPAAMARGEIDVGLGGIPAVVFYVDKGERFRILAPLNVDGDMLLVRPDFPADDWAGFVEAVKEAKRPVRIGYKAPMAVAKLVFVGALEHEGIPVSDTAPPEGGVELVNLQKGGNIVPALESKSVDGAVINEPFGSIAEEKGVGKIVSLLGDLPPDGKWKSHPCSCICAREEAIASHRDALKSLLRLLHTTTAYIRDNPEAAGRLAAKWTKRPESVELRSVPNIVYVMDPGDAYRTGLGTWFAMMDDIGKFEGELSGKTFDEAFALSHDLTLIEEVTGEK